jgi:hypothetical protein
VLQDHLRKKLSKPCLKNKPGVVMHSFVPVTQEEAGGLQFEVNPDKFSVSPYLKTKLK